MLTLAATVIVLGVLIFVHEVGHFLAAKLVGIGVVRFSLGIGPKVWGVRFGETEYAVSALPLGGYVKMQGMEAEALERLEGGKEPARPGGGLRSRSPDRDFEARPVWARVIVVSAGGLMNALFAFAVYGAVAGVWGVPEVATTRIGRVEEEALPPGADALAALPPGAELLRVGGRPVHHWGEVRDALRQAPPGRLSLEFRDRPPVEIRVPREREARERLAGALRYWHPPVIREVSPGSPAARAGVRAGDRVRAVDGVPVPTWDAFVDAIVSHPGEPVELAVLREGRLLVLEVTPRAEEVRDPGTGEVRTVGRIGVLSLPDYVRIPAPPGEALRVGLAQTAGTTAAILDFLWELVRGRVSPRSVGSIVTIGQASGQFARQGMDEFLTFLAFFSVNLAILNLLPIPILDGGHLVFLAIEAVRGRALSLEQRMRLSQIGFILLVGVMLWALSNDLLRILGL